MSKREFVAEVATTIFVERVTRDDIDNRLLARRCVDDAEALYGVLLERELVK